MWGGGGGGGALKVKSGAKQGDLKSIGAQHDNRSFIKLQNSSPLSKHGISSTSLH